MSVFIRNVKQEDLKVELQERSASLTLLSARAQDRTDALAPLFSSRSPSTSPPVPTSSLTSTRSPMLSMCLPRHTACYSPRSSSS